ncbi:hypothetical protein DFH09DRAFT_1273336 [Mycena vulgaris]|nr:hypothetical protein DFH09DRAFT_1273336 [Mycena vulgaris]
MSVVSERAKLTGRGVHDNATESWSAEQRMKQELAKGRWERTTVRWSVRRQYAEITREFQNGIGVVDLDRSTGRLRRKESGKLVQIKLILPQALLLLYHRVQTTKTKKQCGNNSNPFLPKLRCKKNADASAVQNFYEVIQTPMITWDGVLVDAATSHAGLLPSPSHPPARYLLCKRLQAFLSPATEHLGILPSSGFPQASSPSSDPGDKPLAPILLRVLPVHTSTTMILVSSHRASHSAAPPRVDSLEADLRKIRNRAGENAHKLNKAFKNVLSTDRATHGVDDYSIPSDVVGEVQRELDDTISATAADKAATIPAAEAED